MKKREVPCIYLKDGVAVAGFSEEDRRRTAEIEALMQAAEARDGNARKLLVFDFSESDAEHDENIEQIRKICAQAWVPVIGAGRIARLEDIKKFLYAGCEKALLNFRKESNRELLAEASNRFGKEKIAIFVPDAAGFAAYREDAEKYASLLVCEEEEAKALRDQTMLDVIVHDRGSNSATAGEPVLAFQPKIDWESLTKNADGLVPCVVQDVRTDEVLMVAYMNEESFRATMQTGRMTYWSRSRTELWQKGLTSGHLQFLRAMRVDCDNDTLLARVDQVGAACHTGNHSCFYRDVITPELERKSTAAVLDEVYNVIMDRKTHPKEGSYTNYLFDKGIDKILKKLGEEATEIVIAAKNQEKQETVYELSDFLYHAMVLMAEKGITWEELARELANR